MQVDKESACGGVFVEFFDAKGNCVAQALWTPWKSAPLPGVGDRLSCKARMTAGGKWRRVAGMVRHRKFDVQTTDSYTPCVWVRLEVVLASEHRAAPQHKHRKPAQPVTFSLN